MPLVLNVCALGESSVPSVCLTVTACPSMLSLVSPRYDEEMTDTLVSGRGRRTLGFFTGGAKIGTLVAYREFNTVPGAANHLLNLRTGMHVKLASGREGTLARLIGGQLKVATVGHGKQPQHKYLAAVLSRRSEAQHCAVWSFSTMVDVVVRLPHARQRPSPRPRPCNPQPREGACQPT